MKFRTLIAACATFIAIPAAAVPSAAMQPLGADANMAPTNEQLECITEKEVIERQEAWGNGIVQIGKVYSAKGDYRQAAADHIDEFYAYDLSLVLFKPTLAAVEQFRPTFDGALSYFVGGNESYPEDKGFAIKPWSKVRWQNTGIMNNVCHVAIAMGNYYFTPVAGGPETKVEYTIGYIRDASGSLKMAVHSSTIPYSGS